jgi:ABC-2 type transport system permease protein
VTRAVLRKDLAGLWLSPLPWVVGALLHAVLGLLFVDQLRGREQALSQPVVPLAGFLLVLAVPVLAMRSFAEEARTGTLDLLLAVPVAAGRLVAGKWLAAWLTTVAVLAPVAALVGLLELYGEPDYGPVASGAVGLVLLAGFLAAVGVLASSLTSSQPVAAMVAVSVVLVLWFSHVGSEGVGVGSVLAHLSVSERLRGFAAGAVDLADAAFFGAATAVALAAAAVAVDLRRLR